MPSVRDRRIVFGRFHPDLEEALIAETETHRHDCGPLSPSILLVGSNLVGIYLTRLLARRLAAVGGVRVMTFLDLARLLARADLAREGVRPVPETGERLLVRTLVSSLPRDSYFADIARTEGFAEAILATLHEVREAGLAPDELRRAFPKSERKVRDLADLLERYERGLREKRLIDRAGLLGRALALVHDGLTPFPGVARLFVYGFYDFTWLQENLLLRLAASLPTTVFFPWSETPAFEFARDTRSRFLEAGFKEVTTSTTRSATGSALTRLRRTVFVPARPAAEATPRDEPLDQSLRIMAAPGEARETLEAARAIVRLAGEGVPFEDMGVLYRSGDPYARLMVSQLDELGVPFFSLEGESLRGTRAARALSSLLEIREKDHEREAVIDFLSVARLDPAVAAPPNPADWDLLSRLAGIVSGRTEWLKRLDSLARSMTYRAEQATTGDRDDATPPDPRLIEECRRLGRFYARLSKAIDAIPAEGTWREMGESVGAILRRFLLPDDERDAVLETMDDLASLEAIAPRTTLDDFRRLLFLDLERRGARQGHFQRGHLFLGDVQTARGLGFRALVLLGLTEQCFPAPVRQDPILLDTERRTLNRATGNGARLPVKARRSDEERVLFALASGAARDALILTFPRLDSQTARERLPSSFLLRTIEAVTGRSCDYERLQRFLERIRLSDLFPADRALAIREREFDLSVVTEGVKSGKPGLALFPAAATGRPPFFRRGVGFEHQRWGERSLTPVDGLLRDPSVRLALASKYSLAGAPVSPTRLQQYMTCPYQYFCERILGLEPLEAPGQVERLSAQDRGTLMHRVLQEFFASSREAGDLPLRRPRRAELRNRLMQILERRFTEADAMGLTGLQLLRDIERDTIGEDLGRYLDREIEAAEAEGDTGFRPEHFEVRFGMPPRSRRDAGLPPEDSLSTGEPVPLSSDDRSLLFKGQIDRIDRTADGKQARVIDYKSGRIDEYPDNSHHAGTALQAPVYMLAAERLLPGVQVVQAIYQSVSRRGRFGSKVLDRDVWRSVLDDLNTIGGIVERGIGSGAFFPYPEQSTCSRCDARPVCGEAREARFERKRGDPAAASFLEFKTRSERA